MTILTLKMPAGASAWPPSSEVLQAPSASILLKDDIFLNILRSKLKDTGHFRTNNLKRLGEEDFILKP